MALVDCSNCGRMVSDQEEVCPNCGIGPLVARPPASLGHSHARPVPEPKGSPFFILLGVLLILLGIGFAGYVFASDETLALDPTGELFQDRQNSLIFSTAVAVVGLLLVLMGNRMNKAP